MKLSTTRPEICTHEVLKLHTTFGYEGYIFTQAQCKYCLTKIKAQISGKRLAEQSLPPLHYIQMRVRELMTTAIKKRGRL